MLCALLAGIFTYVDAHFHDEATFVDNTATLADNADVRERLFNGFSQEIIALADGDLPDDGEEAADSDTADDDAEGEADDGPVTDAEIERNLAVEEILLDAFDTDLYDEVFNDNLRTMQSDLIRAAELPDEALLRDTGPVRFNARRLYLEEIWPALAANPLTGEITQNEVPAEFGIYDIADRETTVNASWWLLENGPRWTGITTFLAIACLLAAAVIAERRPTRVIQYGAGIIGLALVVIVITYIVRALVPLFASSGSGAVAAVYAANTSPLISAMIRLLIIGAIVAVVGGVARLIWPDDYVYGQVRDERGVRSIVRRKSTPAAEQVPAAAMTQPQGYPAPGQGWVGAPPPGAWGGPWQQQPMPPQGWYPQAGYPQGPYPAGPYAQPQAAAWGNPGAGAPTMPVNAIDAASVSTGESASVPSDAAQPVPKVVASTPPPAEPIASAPPAADVKEPAPSPEAAGGSDAGLPVVEDPAAGWESDNEW